jgi:hypothetical protein
MDWDKGEKRSYGDALFECIALLAVAVDCLNRVKTQRETTSTMTIELVANDINKCYQTLHTIYTSYAESNAETFEKWFWGHMAALPKSDRTSQ